MADWQIPQESVGLDRLQVLQFVEFTAWDYHKKRVEFIGKKYRKEFLREFFGLEEKDFVKQSLNDSNNLAPILLCRFDQTKMVAIASNYGNVDYFS